VIVVLVVAGAAAYVVVSSGSSNGKSQTTSTSTSAYTGTQTFTFQSGGSSFVGPLVNVWIYAFNTYTDYKVTSNYQTIGSAAGQQSFFDGSFTYACSDAPVTPTQLANFTKGTSNTGNTLLQIPEALAAVTIFYNIPQIGNVSLDLTGPVLAGIYDGSIKYWNDSAIQSLNTNYTLPYDKIIPVHRSDGSGTTYALTTYLNKVDPAWNSTIGVGLIVNWPSNELGGTGSGGVAGLVHETPYSIGYADEVYAHSDGLTVARIQNSAGNFTAPTIGSMLDAANEFSTQIQSNPLISITDAPGADSYPISTYTYTLVWKNQPSAAQAYALSTFLWWVVNEGQGLGAPLYFAAIPPGMVAIDNGLINQINYNGQTFAHP
jgi:phosphate transport system substrate-binding protein